MRVGLNQVLTGGDAYCCIGTRTKFIGGEIEEAFFNTNTDNITDSVLR